MNWLIDIGNTNVKWCYVLEGEYLNGGSLPYASLTPEDVLQTIYQNAPALNEPIRVLLANVGKMTFAIPFYKLLHDRNINIQMIESSNQMLGIRNGYNNPSQLGIDRLLAIAAAYEQVKNACIIVDIGTALTLDCVDQTGKHLGGLIVPGTVLLLNSLKNESSKLETAMTLNQMIDLPLLGKNTKDAILAGIHSMIVSFISDQSARLQKKFLNDQKVSLLLTGGGAKHFRPNLDTRWIYEPDLVLKGLYLVLMAEINQ